MKIHYVAFLDILGFKCVEGSEVETGDGNALEKLFRCHEKCMDIFKSDPRLTIIQFFRLCL